MQALVLIKQLVLKKTLVFTHPLYTLQYRCKGQQESRRAVCTPHTAIVWPSQQPLYKEGSWKRD